MKPLYMGVLGIIVTLTASLTGLGGHAAAASPGASGMEHGTSASTACVSFCMSPKPVKITASAPIQKKDDQPEPPAYLKVTEKYLIYDADLAVAETKSTLKRPPKIPPYILLAVFRN